MSDSPRSAAVEVEAPLIRVEPPGPRSREVLERVRASCIPRAGGRD